MKKLLSIIILIALLPITVNAQMKTDAKLHLLAGSTVGASIVQLPNVQEYKDWQKIYVGTLGAAFVGVGKEGYDLVTGGGVQGSDILYTALGGLISSTINVMVIQKIKCRKRKR